MLIDGLQYASMLRNLEEREEGEGERKVASDNELNFRYFNGCICSVFGNLPMDFWVCFCYLFVNLINGIS